MSIIIHNNVVSIFEFSARLNMLCDFTNLNGLIAVNQIDCVDVNLTWCHFNPQKTKTNKQILKFSFRPANAGSNWINISIILIICVDIVYPLPFPTTIKRLTVNLQLMHQFTSSVDKPHWCDSIPTKLANYNY